MQVPNGTDAETEAKTRELYMARRYKPAELDGQAVDVWPDGDMVELAR